MADNGSKTVHREEERAAVEENQGGGEINADEINDEAILEEEKEYEGDEEMAASEAQEEEGGEELRKGDEVDVTEQWEDVVLTKLCQPIDAAIREQDSDELEAVEVEPDIAQPNYGEQLPQAIQVSLFVCFFLFLFKNRSSNS